MNRREQLKNTIRDMVADEWLQSLMNSHGKNCWYKTWYTSEIPEQRKNQHKKLELLNVNLFYRVEKIRH